MSGKENKAKLLPAIKKMWVEDLRSGKFKQGKGKLLDAKGSYCCLGVLCERAVEAGLIKKQIAKNFLDDKYFLFDGSSGLPTWKVFEWATGETAPVQGDEWAWAPYVPFEGDFDFESTGDSTGEASLANLNDDGNLDFNAIADLIEAHL